MTELLAPFTCVTPNDVLLEFQSFVCIPMWNKSPELNRREGKAKGHTPSTAFRHLPPKEGCRKQGLGVWRGARRERNEGKEEKVLSRKLVGEPMKFSLYLYLFCTRINLSLIHI